VSHAAGGALYVACDLHGVWRLLDAARRMLACCGRACACALSSCSMNETFSFAPPSSACADGIAHSQLSERISES
jgi:hypothetical protein